MNIAEKLKQLRESKGLSQNDVAKRLGIGRTTYVKYETGSSSPTRKLQEIADLFEVSTDYLLGRDTTSPKKLDKRPKDLVKILEQEEYTLNGQIATQEDRKKLAKIVEALYWDAKEKNKRKK